MKTIVMLYAGFPDCYQFDAGVGEKSAFEKSLEWALSVRNSSAIIILAVRETEQQCRKQTEKAGSKQSISIIVREYWNVQSLLKQIHDSCTVCSVPNALYAWADCPFLNTALTEKVLDTHVRYAAEYTFADGYPYGFSPEVLDAGTAEILAGLSVRSPNGTGDNPVDRECIFSVLKQDINSFEIETVLSPQDWRQYRFSFACGSKAGFLACKALAEAAEGETDAEKLAEKASRMPGILRTVPSFYNVQIESVCSCSCIYCPYPVAYKKNEKRSRMPLTVFRNLADEMESFSGCAVVALSAWGEPLAHPDFAGFVEAVLDHPGLSVLIETDGTKLTPELADSVAGMVARASNRTNGQRPVIWIVSLDALTSETYGIVRGCSGQTAVDRFEKASAAVRLLQNNFPGAVYPQFVRTLQNEKELEPFYRYWNEPTSPSGGKLIVQKYDNFCGLLPDDKPAELAPLERYPCWHLRRDMTILADGSIPVCREYMNDGIIGNVLEEGIETVWKKNIPLLIEQIGKNYSGKCRVCDEYYTFNF